VRSVLDGILGTPATDQARYQRDGLLFQHIAWIAAAYSSKGGDLLSIPHVRTADKGQEMMIVHTASDLEPAKVVAVTICEDKATDNCRGTFKNKVLPEIERYETGARDAELESETLALLERHHNKTEAQAVLQGVFWDRARRYRVSITTDSDHEGQNGRRMLFAGYDDVAQGDTNRRRGETIHLDHLRDWFDAFATKVQDALTAMTRDSNV
jgi:hypothetical protein